MSKVFFENIHTKNRFEVIAVDKEKGTVTLLGKHGITWEEKYSKERFEEWGYRPVQDATEAQESPQTAPPAPPASSAVPPPPAS